MHKLVLIRHGESQWNKENRFTGWKDVDLSEQGMVEAHAAGKLLKEEGFTFDEAYTSVLKRAIRTLWIILDEMDLMWIPVTKSWLLNERHYGALQGLNKAETAQKHGEDQVKIWRRSYDVPPPPLAPGGEFDFNADPRYAGKAIPDTESLKTTLDRVKPYWDAEIAPVVMHFVYRRVQERDAVNRDTRVSHASRLPRRTARLVRESATPRSYARTVGCGRPLRGRLRS